MNEKEMARRCRDTMWAVDLATQALDMDISVTGPGAAKATMAVRTDMVNGHSVCHGGYIFTLADSAFAFACNTYNRITLAASASIEFRRPARQGDTLTASAVETHRSGRSGIYDVTVTNQDGDLIALFRGRSHATRDPILESDTENIEKS